MSLSTAFNIAQSALLNNSRQTSVLSRNIAEKDNADYSRRVAVLSSTTPGARVIDVQRATNQLLTRNNLNAMSSYQGQKMLLDGLNSLALQVNGPDNANSAATLIGQLQEALHLFSATPSNRTLAENAVEAARQVVRSLNDGSQALQGSRSDADQRIATEVGELNQLLADFHTANTAVVQGTAAGRDVTDALDQRDALLKKIAEKLPVSTMTRDNNDIVIMTGDGAMLYEKVPRTVTFQPISGYAVGTTGNAVYVDGVPLPGGSGANTTASGTISGLLQLRDSVAPGMQKQLDEIARGLITAFAETDPNGVQPAAAGLFTWSGGPAIPAAGTLQNGLAASIQLNAAMDFNVGGDPVLLRDGGANGAAYVWNTGNAASYANQLLSFGDKLAAPMAFDLAAGLGSVSKLDDYSANSISWLEALRKDATSASETKGALVARTSEALSNATGVNMDEEMSLLLDLEHSYQASSRIITAIDTMFSSLLAAVR